MTGLSNLKIGLPHRSLAGLFWCFACIPYSFLIHLKSLSTFYSLIKTANQIPSKRCKKDLFIIQIIEIHNHYKQKLSIYSKLPARLTSS